MSNPVFKLGDVFETLHGPVYVITEIQSSYWTGQQYYMKSYRYDTVTRQWVPVLTQSTPGWWYASELVKRLDTGLLRHQDTL